MGFHQPHGTSSGLSHHNAGEIGTSSFADIKALLSRKWNFDSTFSNKISRKWDLVQSLSIRLAENEPTNSASTKAVR
jgi:hypothetical protein